MEKTKHILLLVFCVCLFITLSYGYNGPISRGSYNNFVARVIFSEAAHKCSDHERKLVASVIKNRINHQGFGLGKLSSMEDVVRQKGAFSCIDDSRNHNWKLSSYPKLMSTLEKHIWQQCLNLTTGNFKDSNRPIVYFHDKSVTKPSSWDNRWWRAHKEIETKHFVFYSIIKNSG